MGGRSGPPRRSHKPVGEEGPSRAGRLTALTLLHDIHHVPRGQSHLGARSLLEVSDGPVRLQDDGARDVWTEGERGERTGADGLPPPGSPLHGPLEPDTQELDPPCQLESGRHQPVLAAPH